jgi:hypothetical protein
MSAINRANSQSRHFGGLADGANVATIDMKALHQDMLARFAEGCRTGIAIELLDGFRASQSLDSMVTFNARRERIEHLRRRRRESLESARQARKLAAEEKEQRDRLLYRQDARAHTDKAERLQEDIRRLETAIDDVTVPDSFDGEVEFLLRGLSALFTSEDGRVDAEAAGALKTVLREPRLWVEGNLLCWRASLEVPADGKVFVLGPFTGSVDARGRILTPAESADLGAAGGSGHRRRALIHRLHQAGYPDHLARAASLAPGGYLPRVLLGEKVKWPDCPRTFDHREFNEYLRCTWGAHPGWAKGVYCQTNASRQALADIVAAFGGTATLPQIRPVIDALRIAPNHAYYMTQERTKSGKSVPPWPATITRTNHWSANRTDPPSAMASIVCPTCDRPATAVVRVLEVPDALLCRICRVMPSRPEFVFPPLYVAMALPPTQLDTGWFSSAT